MSKDASGAEASTASAADADKIFEERGPKTIIRLVTVGAYMFSVSFAAIVLSAYYIFLWHPPNSRLIHAHAAHLRADYEMEFLVADSLTVIQANKSNRVENNNTIKEAEANNRYKYISSPIQVVTENNIFTNLENVANTEAVEHNDEKITREGAFEKKERLQRGRKNIVKKADYNMINFAKRNNSSASSIHEQTRNYMSVSLNKGTVNRNRNFSINSVINNNIAISPENSTFIRKWSREDSERKNQVFNYSNSENTKILKKFFKIL